MAAITASAWQADTVYSAGAWVTPTTANGYWYRASVGGTSDPINEPTWPTTAGGTVSDSGITWVAYPLCGVDPDYSFEHATEYRTTVTRFESGTEQRNANWTAGKRRFSCQYTNRSASEWQSIRDLFDEVQGQYWPFVFQDPTTGSYYLVRFGSDDLAFTKPVPAEVRTFALSLVEVAP